MASGLISGSGALVRESSPALNETWLSAVREWKGSLESLTDALTVSLSETYKTYEPDTTPEMIASLFTDKKFRSQAIYKMRHTSVAKVRSANPDFVSLHTQTTDQTPRQSESRL